MSLSMFFSQENAAKYLSKLGVKTAYLLDWFKLSIFFFEVGCTNNFYQVEHVWECGKIRLGKKETVELQKDAHFICKIIFLKEFWTILSRRL